MGIFGGKIAPALLVPPYGTNPQRSALQSDLIDVTAHAPIIDVTEGPTNPFGDFFVGTGNLGRLNGDAAAPPAGYQSGDIMYAMSTQSAITGWTQVFSGPVNTFTGHIRVATGTGADTIPANLCTNFGTQIVAVVRPNANFTTTGSSVSDEQTGNPSPNFTFPAAPLAGFEPGVFGRIVMFAGYASGLDQAVSVQPAATFSETAQIVDNTFKFVSIFGIAFSLPSAAVPAADAPYTVSKNAFKTATTYAQIMRDLS